jgi:succinate dehydrogenase/fumarate reductase flavoprotein subunit
MPELPVPVLGDLQGQAEKALGRKDGLKPAQIRRQVQEMAHKNLSPIRTQKELSAFLSFLENTIQDEVPQLATGSKSRIYNKEWADAIELENMLHLLKCATIGALHRAESRGVHFREDFPYTDNDHWLKENIIRYEKGALEVYRRPVTTTSMTPPKGKIPYLDMIKKMMESRSDVGGHH